MENTIPKIIHYCWFGNNEKPYEIKKYMKTWKILDDYKVIEWNEKNSNLNSSEYIKKVYSKKALYIYFFCLRRTPTSNEIP